MLALRRHTAQSFFLVIHHYTEVSADRANSPGIMDLSL